MSVRDEDLRAVARFVDGEMSAEERRSFELRLADDAGLRAAVEELEGLREVLASDRDVAALRPSTGFNDRVLREVRRLPSAEELESISDSGSFQASCQRLVVAAAVVMAIGLLVFGGLLRMADSGKLEATEAEMREEMERLDARILESVEDAANRPSEQKAGGERK